MQGPAMVQMVENWTAIDAVVAAAPAPADLPGFDRIELRVERAAPVEGFADLLPDAAGTTLTILLPHDRAAGLCEGAALRLRVRRAPGRMFAHPDMIERR